VTAGLFPPSRVSDDTSYLEYATLRKKNSVCSAGCPVRRFGFALSVVDRLLKLLVMM
jgi:hypothetical protein